MPAILWPDAAMGLGRVHCCGIFLTPFGLPTGTAKADNRSRGARGLFLSSQTVRGVGLMQIVSLDHLVLTVRDVAATCAFYQRGAGNAADHLRRGPTGVGVRPAKDQLAPGRPRVRAESRAADARLGRSVPGQRAAAGRGDRAFAPRERARRVRPGRTDRCWARCNRSIFAIRMETCWKWPAIRRKIRRRNRRLAQSHYFSESPGSACCGKLSNFASPCS